MATTQQSRLGIITLIAAVALGACSDAPTASSIAPMASAVVTTSNFSFPYDVVVGGCIEPVHLTGEEHIVFDVIFASSGNLHVTGLNQLQGMKGIGLFTGAKYRATGGTRDEANYNGPLPHTYSFVDNFRLIGQGPDNNRLVHETIHITINANGEITADRVNITVECR